MERGDWRRGMSLELLTCHEREDRVSVSVGSLTFLTPSPTKNVVWCTPESATETEKLY